MVLAQELQAQGVKQLVITQGSQGATLVDSSGAISRFPAIPVEVVDSTGAGDAFNAALAVALAEGRPLQEAVRFALHGGALACTRLGVIPALPYRHQLPE
jgi:ribokinase